MTIQSKEELLALKAAGRVVALVLDAMEAQVAPGITTGALDSIAARVLTLHGARSAPQLVYRFPAHTCISVNDEVVHGLPGSRALRMGDIVKLDVTVEKNGFMADAARTVVVGAADTVATRLASCTKAAFDRGLAVARAGNRLRRIGREVDLAVRRRGLSVVRELAGHGIGRTIHEPPTVPNFDDTACQGRLEPGMVVTIEPIISAGKGSVYVSSDGWTVRTSDRSLSAHYEHTIVVTRRAPIILTAA